MTRQIGTSFQSPSITELETRIRRLEDQVEHLVAAVEELRQAAKAPSEPVS
jgi:prefoldin subunit 5